MRRNLTPEARHKAVLRTVAWNRNNPERAKANALRWRRKNQARLAEEARLRYAANPEPAKAAQVRFYRAHPWMKTFLAARYRCENPKVKYYHRYGGRGIKFRLTLEECKRLWERDGAATMLSPSIDRIDNDGDYVFANCQFISRSANSKKMWADRKAKGWTSPRIRRLTPDEMGRRHVVGDASPNFGATEQNVT